MYKPKVSVIIPCFNQGPFLEEAVISVLGQTFHDFEIVIVDDGSTDHETIALLKNYRRPNTRVIRMENQGLSAARNAGIREAAGQYILPLDADDKIGPGYLEDAVRILDHHPEIGIVYCEAAYFGMRNDRFFLPEYSLDQLLQQNIIFCSALFRKSDWEKVGGFNINMVYGWEDWDFWLALVRLGVKVYRIPKVYFFYRLRETSMVRVMDEEKRFFMRLHAVLNQKDLFAHVADITVRLKVAELFFDTGIGFTPHQVIRHVIFGGERNHEFDLSSYGQIRRVRFHPINAPVALHLDRVEITDRNNRLHAMSPDPTNACWVKDNHWVFQVDHPCMEFDLSSVESPQKLSISLHYAAIGPDVYPEILKIRERDAARLQEQINQTQEELNRMRTIIGGKQREIDDIHRSTSWRLTAPIRRLKRMKSV